MTPVRIVPLLLIAVCLMGARCTKEEIDTLINNVAGTSPAPQAAALYIAPSVEAVVEDSSSEEVVTVAVAVEPVVYVPPPRECVQSPWRGMEYSCDGKISWPVGEPRPEGVE